MTDKPTVDVLNEGAPVFVRGHGIVAATGRSNKVPDTPETRFLIDTGALKLATTTSEEE